MMEAAYSILRCRLVYSSSDSSSSLSSGLQEAGEAADGGHSSLCPTKSHFISVFLYQLWSRFSTFVF